MSQTSTIPKKSSKLTTVSEHRNKNPSTDVDYAFNNDFESPHISPYFSPSPPSISPSVSPSSEQTTDDIIENTLKHLSDEKLKETENSLDNPNKARKSLSCGYNESLSHLYDDNPRPSTPRAWNTHKSHIRRPSTHKSIIISNSKPIIIPNPSEIDEISKSDLIDIPNSPEPPIDNSKKTSLVRKIFTEIAINIPIITTGIIMFFFCTNPFTGIPFIIIVLLYVIFIRLLVYLVQKIVNYFRNFTKSAQVSPK